MFPVRPWFAVVLSGLSTALAVAASLFVSRFGATTSLVAVGISFVLGATVSYVTSYQPLIQLKQQHQLRLVDIVLHRLISVYQNEIADCRLRANVMTIDGHEHWPWRPSGETLSIAYATEGYSKWERELQFRSGEGVAGKALQERKVVYYDARVHQHLEWEMTVEQRVATDHVGSAVSVPVFPRSDSHRNPIGVLTLDSPQHVGETNFNDEAARTLLVKYASAIEAVLQ